jgi:hypothetical protein
MSSTFTDAVTIVAPAAPGAYSVKIEATSGATAVDRGLKPGNGIHVNFTVAAPATPEPLATVLTVDDHCAVLHQTATIDLTATLETSGGTAIAAQTVTFAIDGMPLGQATTDAYGVATLENVDVSAYSVGDHDISVAYAGQESVYLPTNGFGNLGISYLFVGFQQPINADGTSLFGGRTIPVKIKLADANAQPVTDAVAHVFFDYAAAGLVGVDAEPLSNTNGDSGNLMRYDATADQYIFNWDTAGLANGTYKIYVDLGEGQCASPHAVIVTLKKKGSK